MNHLVTIDERTCTLPKHAHVIVHGTDDGTELLTIYDCGAAQKPPAAQLIGNLVGIDFAHERISQPTATSRSFENRRCSNGDTQRWIVR